MVAVERVINIVAQKYPGYSIRRICEEEGIILRRDMMGRNYFGLYMNLYGQGVISVRDDLNFHEETEVMAHESYHHFFLQFSEGIVERNLLMERRCIHPFLNFYVRKEELGADLFAAYFLCPDVSDCTTYQDIMQKYDRSKEVAKLRMVAEQKRIYGGANHGLSTKER